MTLEEMFIRGLRSEVNQQEAKQGMTQEEFARRLSKLIDDEFGTTTDVFTTEPSYLNRGTLHSIPVVLSNPDGEPLELVIDICERQD